MCKHKPTHWKYTHTSLYIHKIDITVLNYTVSFLNKETNEQFL